MKIMQRLFLRYHLAFLLIAATVLVPMDSQADTEIEIKHIIESILKIPNVLLFVMGRSTIQKKRWCISRRNMNIRNAG